MVRSTVDYSLLIHHTVRQRLTELAHSELSPLMLDAELDKLGSLEGNLAAGALTLLEGIPDEKVTHAVCGFLMKLESADVVDVIMPFLYSQKITDTSKADLLRVLSFHGWEVQDFLTPSIFQDVQKLAVDSMEELLRDLSRDPDVLGNILEEFAEFSPEMQLAYIQDWALLKDARVVPIFAALGHSDDEVIAAEAIRGLGSLPTAESLAALIDILVGLGQTFLRDLALREERRLRFKGIVPAEPTPRALGDFFSVMVTGLDGNGCRIVWLARFLKGSQGSLMAASFLVSAEDGLKDCYGSTRLSQEDAESLLETLRSRYTTIDDDLPYATAILEDGLFTNKGSISPLPPQWYFWQQILHPVRLCPRSFTPAAVGPDPDLTPTALAELLQTKELSDWYEEDPAVYDAAEELTRIRKRYKTAWPRSRATEDLLTRLVTHLYQPRLDQVIRRLDLTADFLARRGKPTCASALGHITRRLRHGEPPAHNAFLRGLASMSLRVAEHNLRSGYDVRKDPDFLE
ncbi:MAG TPA: hypothetical protein VK905_05560 [Bacillota bacterium]|nr:hypothetical protein [Bacillota bacterium]